MPITKDQSDQIEAQRSQQSSTVRATAPELEKMLYKAIPVLDHGFIRVIDYMGTDSAIPFRIWTVNWATAGVAGRARIARAANMRRNFNGGPPWA